LKNKASIYWIRQDLRLYDNPALIESVKNGTIIPIYILDDINSKEHKMGQASKIWLHHSLKKLNKQMNNNLLISRGNPENILLEICKLEKIKNVFWNRVYEPWAISRDKKIKENFNKENIEVVSLNGSLLWEPWDVLKSDGTPYRVFTPFYRRGCLNAKEPRRPIKAPTNINYFPIKYFKSLTIDDLDLLPNHNWKDKITNSWNVGEEAALLRLDNFIEAELDGYKEGRNFPTKKNVSRLSPHLHWGEISPNTVWYKIKDLSDIGLRHQQDTDTFLSEMGWRNFLILCYTIFQNYQRKTYKKNLIYLNGTITNQNLNHGKWVKQVIQ